MGQGLNSTQVSVENSSERVSYLEKKLFALQEELTDLHRKRSENAQQIIDQVFNLPIQSLGLSHGELFR